MPRTGLDAALARPLPAGPDGVLDALGDGDAPPSTGRVQDLMLSRAVPRVYEGLWRPLWGSLATGPLGPDLAEERRMARSLLGLRPGQRVLDVACGSGGFTRAFARAVGTDGLAVGVDASPTMLARAVRDTPRSAWPHVAYVRADAAALPFLDGTFDGACSYLALHLMADPSAALDELARVLAPGGRVALMTTSELRSVPGRLAMRLGGRASGQRVFGREEVVEALERRGLEPFHVHRTGVLQFVAAAAPGRGDRPGA